MKLSLSALALVVASQGFVCAQSFEVASVRENPGPAWSVRIGFASSGPRVSYQVWAVPELIQEAFGLKQYAVIMPASAVPTAFYDITAKAEGNDSLTRDRFRPLLQKLLADRFALKVHRETRDIPVYAMVIGKGGRKFHESDPEEPAKNLGGVYGRNQSVEFQQGTMEMLADRISVDRPVIDKTGLTGKYDVKLIATPEFRINNNPQPDDIRVFDAIQQQLRLRLEAQKVPMEVLVVDHVEKPSEN